MRRRTPDGGGRWRDLGSTDPAADAAAAEAAGLATATTRRWTRPADDDLQDQVGVTIASFGDADAAAGEFGRLRTRAEANVDGYRADGESAFVVPGSTMVQIDPNTGQQVGPDPRADVVVAHSCEHIVIAYVFAADAQDFDQSIVNTLILDVIAPS